MWVILCAPPVCDLIRARLQGAKIQTVDELLLAAATCEDEVHSLYFTHKKALTNRGHDDSRFVDLAPREPLIAHRRPEPREIWHVRPQSEGPLAIYCARPGWTALLLISKPRPALPDHEERCMTTAVAEARDGCSKNLTSG